MLTYEEIKSLVVLVFWLVILWRTIVTFFVTVLKAFVKAQTKTAESNVHDEPPTNTKKDEPETKPRAKGPIGFKSDY